MARTVCIDFDGVLAQYDGWRGETHTGLPIPGARDFVRRLVDEGFHVVIHTTRPADVVRNWLVEHGFPMVDVSAVKPPALVYIDDRGHRFDGDWESAYQAIYKRPWWRS